MIILDSEHQIYRQDKYNWILQRSVPRIAKNDSKKHKKGEAYASINIVGYYPTLALAFAKYCDMGFDK